MVVAKEKVVKKIEIANKKPLIRKNHENGEMVAMEVGDERDIDEFLDRYDLSVVMISKM